MNEDASRDQNQQGEQPPQQPPQQPAPPPPQYQAAPPPPPGGYYAPPRYPPPPPRRERGLGFLIPVSLAVGCLPWLILFGLIIVGIMGAASGTTERGDHVALIRVSGLITAGKSGSSIFSGTISGSEDIVEQLEKARTNDAAKAIVLRINSPGGSPSGSEEVWKEIQRVRRDGKVVYISMADVAASGGYYIASAADKIYADDSTITGSIGVIFTTSDLSGLYKKIGVNPETIKSGKFKDIGSPDRPLTLEERKLLQGIVDSTFNTFVQAVADGRKMPVPEVKKIADGRVFTGRQALKVNLVDDIGGLRETTLEAARVGGIKGEPRVVEYGRRGFFETIFGTETGQASSEVERAVTRKMLEQLLRSQDTPQPLR